MWALAALQGDFGPLYVKTAMSRNSPFTALWRPGSSPMALALLGLAAAWVWQPQPAPSPFVLRRGPPLPPPLRVRWGLDLSSSMPWMPLVTTSPDLRRVVVGAITSSYVPEPVVCARVRELLPVVPAVANGPPQQWHFATCRAGTVVD